ncbi:MAG: phage tail protein [Pseudomonadales bacterium]|nr:phage tail protein [Pseudomonadales bacterium]
MADSNYLTPGVYVEEMNSFPGSAVPVATAVPAFIGYTPRAEYEGQSYLNKPVKITSFAEFQAIFMLPDPPPPADKAKQYSPQYYLVEQEVKPGSVEFSSGFIEIDNTCYALLPDPSTLYYLYNSIRLFYQNGGGDAYIVSVGNYGAPSGQPMAAPGTRRINPNVKLDALLGGVSLLKKEPKPTLYICPEATLLSVADNSELMQSMLLQAEELQTCLCLFDVIGARDPDPINYTQDIETFRNSTGSNGLKYGAGYYPFINTTVMQGSEVDFENLFGGDTRQLEPLLNPPQTPNPNAKSVLDIINPPAGHTPPPTAPKPAPIPPRRNSQLNNALINASRTYQLIMDILLEDANCLPPSGAMAGVYTVNDNERGVWNAPANTSIVGAVDLPIKLNDAQQADLNVDAVSGKSINAIRFFNGQGILVWGARTLDGNSQDWRYISVRRTITFIEQSVKLATRAYVFEPNNPNTWATVKSMISNFLTTFWKQGGLQGATPADAFAVEVGLGSTMTAEDLLKGVMNVSVKVAVVHPAEFIIISFQQQMAESG